jgi:hypothetical protein
MINRFDNYRFEGIMQKAAIFDIKQKPNVERKHIDELNAAYRYGKRLAMGVQFPVIVLACFYFGKYVPKYTPERKIFVYTLGIGAYYFFYTYTKAWAWHTAFLRVEPIIKEYIINTPIEDLEQTHTTKSS